MATSRPAARVLRYLQSTRNLVGSVLGLVALVLSMLGVAGRYWPVVVAGAYLAGALATPPDRHLELGGAPEGSPEDLKARLGELWATVRRHSPALPPAAVTRFDRIARLLIELLGRPEPLSAKPENYFAVANAIQVDLPASIEAHLNLPRWYAAGKLLPGGRTADAELDAQLDAVERTLTATAESVYAADAGRVVEQSRRLGATGDAPEPARDPGDRGTLAG